MIEEHLDKDSNMTSCKDYMQNEVKFVGIVKALNWLGHHTKNTKEEIDVRKKLTALGSLRNKSDPYHQLNTELHFSLLLFEPEYQ